MNEFTSIIIDDEPGNIITLTELLKEYCDSIKIEGSATDPMKGYELIQKIDPDIIFLDIEMPYYNAFDLLDKLAPVRFEVIFVTAFDNYAIKAIKYAALDYILKPVNITELKDAVKKAEKRLEERNINIRINSLLSNFKENNPAIHKIGLPTAMGFQFEDINNIMHLQAEGSYTNVYIKGKKKEMVSKNLKEFEDILPANLFCRIHHSHIININFVKKYFKGRGGYIEMENGATIEVSVRKKNDFFEKFKH
jgi:two-component system, LytTR family, response regulator